jgi:hypothetical protein
MRRSGWCLLTVAAAGTAPTWADEAVLPELRLALDQTQMGARTRDCSCSTGVGVCHVKYNGSDKEMTCENLASAGEQNCTGTCAFGPWWDIEHGGGRVRQLPGNVPTLTPQ